MNYIYQFYKNWKSEFFYLFSHSLYLKSFLLGGGLLVSSIYFSLFVSTKNDVLYSSTPVEDLFFSIIPILDLSYVFVVLEVILIVFVIIYGVFVHPKKLPFALLAFALFIAIRAFCISLTYIGVPVDYVYPTLGTGYFFFYNDLFFSGHTGAPFLVALVLWEILFWRYFFIFVSVLMAFTVLAMRIHYSIDIVGAYFITYGVFKITENIVHRTSFFSYDTCNLSDR